MKYVFFFGILKYVRDIVEEKVHVRYIIPWWVLVTTACTVVHAVIRMQGCAGFDALLALLPKAYHVPMCMFWPGREQIVAVFVIHFQFVLYVT